MARRHLLGVFATLTMLAPAGAAFAQRGDSGQITGYVFDQAGNPLPGVKITASSDTQIGGGKTTYTSAEGAFRFPVLEPGVFKVRASAPKLQTLVQDNVKVGLNAPIELNLVMEVATTKVEEVKVVERAPLVSTSTPNVKEVFDIDFVETMPHDNRDVVFQQITNYAAGAIRGGRVRGGAGNQTMYMMDGFNMLRQYPTLKASSAYELQTAAYGAENATAPGGVVNLATRSGSNKFELELNATADNSALNFFKKDFDAKASSHFYVVNPTVSGPIIRDKLWYSANVEFLTRKTGRDFDVPTGMEPAPEFRYWHKGTVKLTWQVTARNKLASVTNFDEFWQKNRQGAGFTDDAQTRHRSRNYFTGLIWESLLTDNFILRSQAAVSNIERRTFPSSCDEDPNCDHIPATLQTVPSRLVDGNANLSERSRTYSAQAVNRIEAFFSSKVLGEHHLQLQDFVMVQGDMLKASVPGDRVWECNGPCGADTAYLTTYYANDPRLEDTRYGWFINNSQATRHVLSLSDRYRPTRHLTITPGIALVQVRAESTGGQTVFDGQDLSPNLSVAWDATHDGRTVLRASFAKYLDAEAISIAGHIQGRQVSQRCRASTAALAAAGNDFRNPDAYDRECTYSGGAAGSTVGLPCGPTGVNERGERCNTKLRLPQTWEYTIGGEREVVEGLAIGVDGIYRKYTHQFERFETNRIWNDSGSGYAFTGGFRNGRNTTVSDLETREDVGRRYVGVTASITRREGKARIRGSYTWSKLDGTTMDGSDNAYGDRAARDIFLYGPLGDDHRHEVKANLSYRITPWLTTAVRYSYYSGLPYSRLYRNPETNSFDDYRARQGYSPGASLNDPADDRPLRMPDIMSVNAQVAFNLQPLLGQTLETYVDVLNVFAMRTINAVEQQDGSQFGSPRGWEGPLRIRLGLRYKY
jgi:hypothetical protein